jgi:predicted transcriptional regulator of viral defense system
VTCTNLKALFLHGLSDVLPARVHLTLPASWRARRLRVPRGVVLHHADVAKDERAWVDAVPVTAPRRTLADCIEAGVSPDLVEQAIDQAATRGVVPRAAVTALRRAAGARAP